MATTTTNYGWTKPSYEDDADIMVINDTIDDIDAQVKLNETNISVNRVELVELVDSGAKNNINNTLTSGTTPSGGIAYAVNADKSITVTGGTATANADIVIPFTVNKSGAYILTGGAAGGSSTTYKAQIALYPSMTGVVEFYDDTFAETTLTAGIDYAFLFRVYSGKTVPDCTIYPMVCLKAAWDISQAYVPYRPPYQELYEQVEALSTKTSINYTQNLSDTLVDIQNSDFTIYKIGKLCIARITLKISGTLTGNDELQSTVIPSGYLPKFGVAISAISRDGGNWANANYIPVVVSIGADGKVYLRTGTSAATVSNSYVTAEAIWFVS